jgi:lipopolysaccharide export system permease protein
MRSPYSSSRLPLLSPILIKYILKEIILFFLICLTAFTGILLTVRMLKFASLVVNKGVELSQIGLVLLSIIPTFLEIALPLSTLLAVMLAFARLSGDSELVVLRASGIPLYALIFPVILFGISTFGLGYLVSSYLKPWGYTTLNDTFFEIAKTKTTAGITEGLFNKLGSLTLYAETMKSFDDSLTNVLIEDRRVQQNQQARIITAKKGQIISESTQQSIFFYLFDGEIHEINENKYSVTQFVENRIVLSPDELYDPEATAQGKSAKSLSNFEIKQSLLELDILKSKIVKKDLSYLRTKLPLLLQQQLYREPITRNVINKKLIRLELEREVRSALPLASLILAILGMSLGIQPQRTQRSWGAGLSVGLGMAVFTIYFSLLSLGLGLAESMYITPIIAVWFPNLAITTVSLYLIYYITTEKWSSAADILSFRSMMR